MFDKYFERDGEFRDNIKDDLKEKIKFLWGLDNNHKKVFFSKSINHINIEKFVDDIFSNEDNFNGKILVDLDKFNGDEISIKYLANNNGYISYIDNWSPGWSVIVNNEYQKMEKVLKSYKSVKINKGINKIKFIYKPW